MSERRGLTSVKVLDLARDSMVTNPKDKLAGLLGLLSGGKNAFRPDYSWSIDKLFHQFAIYIIGAGRDPRQLGIEDRRALLSHAGF